MLLIRPKGKKYSARLFEFAKKYEIWILLLNDALN